MQRMVRAAFNTNNIDTCARVCHSPTGYGLKQTFGEFAGTQDFKSVDKTDVILLIGANPTDAHPVFASRMKKRLREGAKLIVVDPRRIDLVRSPHVEAAYHLQLQPSTNVAMMNAFGHVIATENLIDRKFHQPPVRDRGLLSLGRVHQAAGALSRSTRADHWRSCPAGARSRPALRHRWKRQYLLRSRRH